MRPPIFGWSLVFVLRWMLKQIFMPNLQLHHIAPRFELRDQNGTMHRLEDYRGKWVLLYFYPKDMTPGCTQEACAFRDRFSELKKADIVVLGVSKDSIKSHEKFSAKYSLPFPLLADEQGDVIKAYGAWGEKKFLGRTFQGIRRWSFLIDPMGCIAKVYEQVKPKLHADEVMNDVVSFQNADGKK